VRVEGEHYTRRNHNMKEPCWKSTHQKLLKGKTKERETVLLADHTRKVSQCRSKQLRLSS